MKIIFMGNPPIACPILESLHASEQHDVVGVVSNAPKTMGRGRSLRHTAVGEYAIEKGMNFIPVSSLTDSEFTNRLKALNPDIFIVVAFRILPIELLTIPKRGAMNLHTSLLPKYRGAAPIQHAIMNGDKETGITTFIIEPKVDTGGIIFQESMAIKPEDDFGTISKKMADQGGPLVIQSLDALADGKKPIPQDHSAATAAPKITKEMCGIDWSQTTQSIHNQIRGLSPFPGSFSSFKGKRIKIYKTGLAQYQIQGVPGELFKIEKNRLVVCCGDGALELLDIQLEGKKRMAVSDWLKGAQISAGDRFES